MFVVRGVVVLVGKSVVAIRRPSAKRSCMVSACLIMLFLVWILSERVGVVCVGGGFCISERSLPISSCSWAVGCCVAVLISSAHWASKGCGIGNWKRMGLGWSGSSVGFVVDWWGDSSSGNCMVVLTPLWSRNACGMICVSVLCRFVLCWSYIKKWSMHVACDGRCVGLKVICCGPSNRVNGRECAEMA
jgi:hypothetical protein